MTHILIVAWEYPGMNSSQGQALVRRIGQLLRGFLSNGYKVTFLHHDKKNETQDKSHVIYTEGNLTRIAVAFDSQQKTSHPLFRKFRTFWEVATRGDYTGNWANACIKLIGSEMVEIQRPHAILAFSSPKGPIYLAHVLAKKFKTKYFVDYQDPYFEGTGAGLIKKISDYWTKKTLKQCTEVTIINRFWAEQLKTVYEKKITVLDHAIPSINIQRAAQVAEKYVYYSGNVNESIQDVAPFMIAFDRFCSVDKQVYLKLSTNDVGMAIFTNLIKKYDLKNIRIQNTGWIPIEQVYQNMADSWFLLLISLHTDFKKGIASKFYEYMAFERPIMITGNDSGGTADFLKNHGHKDCILKDADTIYNALLTDNEISFFKKENCTTKPITEHDLVQRYMRIMA